jgi:uncharacterized protein
MRKSDLHAMLMCGALVGAFAGIAAPAAAQSQDPAAVGPRAVLTPNTGGAQAVPLAPFSNARDAMRAGVRNYNAGDKAGAAQALEFAAGQGHALALWKLAQMYAAGDGVPHDDLKAFEYFSKIADEFADETPGSQNARVVASAFVALGGFLRDGISNTYVKPNPARAFEMFHYAASYYGDADAQFHLSRMFLDGKGTARDARQAGRWANLSAEKGHVEGQALLGQMMMAGNGMPRQMARGLMWLTLARDGADPARHKHIMDAHGKAFDAASQEDRDAAMALLQRHLNRGR